MRITAVVLALLVGLSSALRAQATVTVPPDDPVYRDVDRLIDAGLADSVIVAQRPYSRRLLARIAGQARAQLAAAGEASSAPSRYALSRLLHRIETDLSPLGTTSAALGRSALLHSVRLDALITDAPTRAVPGNGLGTVEADLNTLTDYRFGRRYVTGGNIALETEHAVQLPMGVSLQARPRLWASGARDGRPSDVSAELLAANARLVVRNVALTVGRDYTVWSPAEGAGLFFSANAPALNMIRVASDAPFLLPSLLRKIGPVAATLQLADLGPSVSNSHSRLVSYKVSVKPARNVELGATFENNFGGAGARNPASAFDRFVDLVPFLDIFKRHSDSTDFDSDKLLGLDGSVRLRQAGNVTLFGEVAIEDFDVNRVRSIFTEDAAYSAGLLMPRLLIPELALRITYHTVGIRFYQHHLVKNGIASRRFLLGDNLGRDATGWSGMLRWEGATGVSITADGALEERRNHRYEGAYTEPNLKGLVFRRVATAPREGRARGLLGVRWFPRDGPVMLEVRGGAERITNFNFIDVAPRTHGLAAITVTAFR